MGAGEAAPPIHEGRLEGHIADVGLAVHAFHGATGHGSAVHPGVLHDGTLHGWGFQWGPLHPRHGTAVLRTDEPRQNLLGGSQEPVVDYEDLFAVVVGGRSGFVDHERAEEAVAVLHADV